MKPVSRFARPLALDRTMSRGWRALEEENVGGWIARFSGGVTKRANSVLPSSAPEDLDACIAKVERSYASRGLPAVFHISPESLPPDLDARLCERGYRRLSPTLVQYLPLEGCGNASTVEPDQRIELADEASPRWCEAFWGVEGPDTAGEQAICREILSATPSLYASLLHDGRLHAVGRLALVGDLGGIYSVATRVGSRSRGYGRSVVRSLIEEASRRNLEGIWLQVAESNSVARGLYGSLGFETISGYHYRQAPGAEPTGDPSPLLRLGS